MKFITVTSAHINVVNLFIILWIRYVVNDLYSDFTVGNSLFGAVKLTKDFDPDKYGYSGYGNGFGVHSFASFPSRKWGEGVVFSGLDNSSLTHTDHIEKIP